MLCVALFLLFMTFPGSDAAVETFFDTIGPANLADLTLGTGFVSMPFQAQQTSEYGDQVQLTEHAFITTIKVVMVTWACESVTACPGCTTSGFTCNAPTSSYPLPVKLKLYQLVGDAPGSVLYDSGPVIFNAPFRPATDPSCYSSSNPNGGWLTTATGTCSTNIAFPIEFSIPNLLLDKFIWTVQINTTTWGYGPLGAQACSLTQQGCYYDSTNVALSDLANGPVVKGTDPFLGSVIRYTAPPSPGGTTNGNLCQPSMVNALIAEKNPSDDKCWCDPTYTTPYCYSFMAQIDGNAVIGPTE